MAIVEFKERIFDARESCYNKPSQSNLEVLLRNVQLLRGGALCALVASPLLAQVRLKPVDGFTLSRLKSQRAERARLMEPRVQGLLSRGKNPRNHEFRVRSSEVDAYGRTVLRYDHYWQGLRITGVSAVGILGPDDQPESLDYGFKKFLEPEEGLQVARLAKDAAEIKARAALGGRGHGAQSNHQELVLEPQIERIQLPWRSPWPAAKGAGDPALSVRVLKGWKLVYHIEHSSQKEALTTRVDAQSGEILSSTLNASCAPTPIMGRGEYTNPGGTITLLGESTNGGYALKRGNLFGVHAGNVLNGIYWNASPSFGNGLPWVPGQPLGSVNGQTQAVDVMHGLNTAYDFFRDVFGRDHFDSDNGYYIPVAVHQDALGIGAKAWWSSNAWGQERYWMDFNSHANAAGGHLGAPTELSVVGHEWSHLVNFRSAEVGRDPNAGFEQKALNEAMSTILGTAMRLWDSTGRASTIGTPDPGRWKFDWSYQPQLHGGHPYDGEARGTQILFRPKLRGEPTWWTYAGVGVNGNFYNAGAPLQRAFYFLANGANRVTNSSWDTDEERGRTTPFLAAGFEGIGAHQAAQVFYQALTQTMGRGTDLHAAAGSLADAGAQLFGAGSTQVKAIKNALAAVNLAWPEQYPLILDQGALSAATGPTLPPRESYFYTPSEPLGPGNGAHYFHVTVPPTASLSFNIGGEVLPVAEDGHYPGIQVWNESTDTILASGAPTYLGGWTPPPDQVPNLDSPPPEEWNPGTTTFAATVAWRNDSLVPRKVMVQIRSVLPRTQPMAYTGNGALTLREFLQDPQEAIKW